MNTLENYRQIIQTILVEYSQLPYAHGELERQLIIDKNDNHYILVGKQATVSLEQWLNSRPKPNQHTKN